MNIVNHIRLVTDWLHGQRDRWILWSPVPLALGIALYFSLHFEPPVVLGLLPLAILVLIALGFGRGRMFFLVWLPFFLMALGFASAQVRTRIVDAPVLERETYPLMLEGRIVEVDALPEAYRIVVDNIKVEAKRPPKTIPEHARIKLTATDQVVPEAGDVIRVKAVLLPLSPPVLPDAFDFQRHAYFKQLGATGYAIGKVETIQEAQESFFFERARHAIRTRIDSGIENRDVAAVVTAFLIGESKGISETTWDEIRAAGIAHLLAISGFHITVLTGFVFFLVRALLAAIPFMALNYPIKKIAAVAAMAGAIFYMLLIGSPVTAERAVIMACVVMTAIILDRDPFTLRLAAFAAIVLLLLQPESLVGPSFQLSFAAVVALIAFFEGTRDWWRQGHEDRSWVRKYSIYILACFLTTLIASLATAPFTLYHFSRLPFAAGLAVNMVAVPVTSFVTLPFGILACLLMPFGLENWPLWVAGKSIEIVLEIAREAANWPHAVYHANAWPASIAVAMTFGGLWICIWQGRARYLGLVPVIFAACMIPFAKRPDIVVSAEGKIFAVRGADGRLWLSSARQEKFIRDEWIEREGAEGYGFWDDRDAPVICDDKACLFIRDGYTVSFVQKPEAVIEDCATADMFVSGRYLATGLCPAKRGNIIDKGDLRRKGAHAVYLGSGKVFVEAVGDKRGVRPWSGDDSAAIRNGSVKR